jgi:hypothetical protein
MPGLGPGIHDFCDFAGIDVVDARVKPGHDGEDRVILYLIV